MRQKAAEHLTAEDSLPMVAAVLPAALQTVDGAQPLIHEASLQADLHLAPGIMVAAEDQAAQEAREDLQAGLHAAAGKLQFFYVTR
jgi:hypothetical protein